MFQKQERGTRLGFVALVLCGALLGVLYYPRASDSAAEALARVESDAGASTPSLVDLHEQISYVSDQAALQLMDMADWSQQAQGLREKVTKFYTSAAQELDSCVSGDCKFMEAFDDMNEMMDLLEDVNYFAGNSTESKLNHNEIQQAYNFVRINMAKLVQGDMDISLESEIAVLQDSAAQIRDVIADMSAVTVRIAYDALDVVKYQKITRKYAKPLQGGGQLSMDKLMNMDMGEIDALGDLGAGLDDLDLDFDTLINDDSPPILIQREKVEGTVFKGFDRSFRILDKSLVTADEKMGTLMKRLDKVTAECRKAIREMDVKKGQIAALVAKENRAIAKKVAELQGQITVALKQADLAEDAKRDMEFVMAPVPTNSDYRCPESAKLKEKERCYHDYFKGARGWWEGMHGPDKAAAQQRLVQVYGREQLNGKNYWNEYRHADKTFRQCDREAQELRRTCYYAEQQHKNRQAEIKQQRLVDYKKKVEVAKRTQQKQHWEQQEKIHQFMITKVKAEAQIAVVIVGQEERKMLWKQWEKKFDIIRLNGEQVEASAGEAKLAANTYRQLLQNGITEFKMIRADHTPAKIDWDEMDFEAVVGKAVHLLKASQKAYKQCSAEIGNYKKMIDKSMDLMLEAARGGRGEEL